MQTIIIADCSYPRFYDRNQYAIQSSVNWLNYLFANKKFSILHVGNYAAAPQMLAEQPLGYEWSGLENDSLKLFSSHYIGEFIHNDLQIRIEPRFGAGVLQYLLFAAANVYLPNALAGVDADKDANLWLAIVLWREMLNKCLMEASLPRNYKPECGNLRHVRGRVDFRRDSIMNIVDKSRVFCRYRLFSPDNTINRTILHVLRLVGMQKQKELRNLLSEFTAYGQRLLELGVREKDVSMEEIDKIVYSPMTAAYRPLMSLSARIIAKIGLKSGKKQEKTAFFLDMAELWESYLLSVLRKWLPGKYRVHSPNMGGGAALLENGARMIRPDIVISHNHKPIMIIDAKYKPYASIGHTAIDGISREDLYQLIAYMHHYSNGAENIAGIVSSPVQCVDERTFALKNAPNQHLGLINLNLGQFDGNAGGDLKKMLAAEEKAYASRIEAILQKTMANACSPRVCAPAL